MYSLNRFNIYNCKLCFAVILSTIAILSGLILSSSRVSADSSAVVDIAVDIPTSCSIVASRESVSTTIIPGNSGEIGDTTIKAICNDPAGLAVYAIGYTNDAHGNNNLVSTIGGNTINIPTGIVASPTTSQWNMTINAVSGTYTPTITQDFDDTAHIIPTEYTKVAYRNTVTDSGTGATGAQFTTTFNAYIANDQPAGTYTGKVKFLLVHPNITDSSTNPATTLPDTLYLMQNVSEWQQTVASGQTVTAMDERDGEIYKVARLADGKLWMTENLRLDIATANITAQNTNSPASSFVTDATDSTKNAANGIWCSDETDSTCTDRIKYNTENLNDANYGDYGVYYNWYTATAGNGTYSAADNSVNTAGDICPSGWRLPKGTSTNNAPWFWTGDFWELSAAFSGLSLDELDSDNYMPVMSNDNIATLRASPNNFLLSGMINPGSGGDNMHAGQRGEWGYYWTSTPYSNEQSYTLHFGDGYGYVAGYSYFNKINGLTVRCVQNQS